MTSFFLYDIDVEAVSDADPVWYLRAERPILEVRGTGGGRNETGRV